LTLLDFIAIGFPMISATMFILEFLVPKYIAKLEKAEQDNLDMLERLDLSHRMLELSRHNLEFPRPAEPTMCLLDHTHELKADGSGCVDGIPYNFHQSKYIRSTFSDTFSPPKELSPYVKFDPDLYDIGVIEPVITNDQLKWRKAK
jgi:hypothetical protein